MKFRPLIDRILWYPRDVPKRESRAGGPRRQRRRLKSRNQITIAEDDRSKVEALLERLQIEIAWTVHAKPEVVDAEKHAQRDRASC